MSLMSPQLTLTHNALNWMRPPKRATQQADGKAAAQKPKGKATQADLQVRCRATTSIERAIDDYLQDHDGGNHSEKTLEWHRTPLGMRQHFLENKANRPANAPLRGCLKSAQSTLIYWL
jgi:hypothetical protein